MMEKKKDFNWFGLCIALAIIGYFGIFWTLSLSNISIDIRMDDNSLEAFKEAIKSQNEECYIFSTYYNDDGTVEYSEEPCDYSYQGFNPERTETYTVFQERRTGLSLE